MSVFVFFWGNSSKKNKIDKEVFSNFYKCYFIDNDNITYNCSEQYFMTKKAQLFLKESPINNQNIINEILSCNNPKKIKELGRKVKGFDQCIWDNNCYKIMFDGCKLKFSQNKILYDVLLDTYPNTLVEASPYDKIWGIGLNEYNAKKISPEEWPGKNLLGKILTELRNELILIAK